MCPGSHYLPPTSCAARIWFIPMAMPSVFWLHDCAFPPLHARISANVVPASYYGPAFLTSVQEGTLGGRVTHSSHFMDARVRAFPAPRLGDAGGRAADVLQRGPHRAAAAVREVQRLVAPLPLQRSSDPTLLKKECWE